jgi:hypothetical protein
LAASRPRHGTRDKVGVDFHHFFENESNSSDKIGSHDTSTDVRIELNVALVFWMKYDHIALPITSVLLGWA